MHYQKMKQTIATLTTGKEEDEQPPIKMHFLGRGIGPKLMAEV
jgi:truncated hemoglobin YjbI